MGKRGIDKRKDEKIMNKFHQSIDEMINIHRLAYVIINNKRTKYIISSNGILYNTNIREGKTELKIIKPYIDKDAHLRVGLRIDGKQVKKYIHVLVANAFIPNPDNKPFVHHIDGDSLNNKYTNLLWVTKNEHDFLTNELKQYYAPSGEESKSSVYKVEQIEKALKLMSENKLYPDEICKECDISYNAFQHLRLRNEYWNNIKKKYDISNYNKFRRLSYKPEQKDQFVLYRKLHPDSSLKEISHLMGIRYPTIKKWNQIYIT